MSLSTIALASARSIGPGLAGLAFQEFGATVCMMINSGSFLLVFVAIVLIRPARLHAGIPRGRTEAPGPSLRKNRPLITFLVVNVIGAIVGGIVASARTSTPVRIAERDDAYFRETVLLSAPRSTLEA